MRYFDYIIVGGGPCGCAAAARISEVNAAASLLIVSEEAQLGCERPLLSKSVLSQEEEPKFVAIGEVAQLDRSDCTVLAGSRVVSLERATHQIVLESGERFSWGKLLIATGAVPKRAFVRGESLGGVFRLRTWSDASSIRDSLRLGKRVVVVGGGFIGLEVAASARLLGNDVIVLEAGDRLLGRTMPASVSDTMLRKFRLHDVDVRLNTRLAGFDGNGSVSAVELTSGEHLPADTVVIGIGIAPAVDWLGPSGAMLENGVLTDAVGRTADPSIFAAGDVANRSILLSGVELRQRTEAWEPAREQGRTAADAMLGREPISPRAPWVWSDQFDWNIQSVGHGTICDTEIIRGNTKTGRFIVFQMAQGHLVGAVTLNAGKDMILCRRAVERGAAPDVRMLADEAVPLREALASAVPVLSSGTSL